MGWEKNRKKKNKTKKPRALAGEWIVLKHKAKDICRKQSDHVKMDNRMKSSTAGVHVSAWSQK